MLGSFLVVLTISAGWMCPAHFAPLPSGWVQGNLGAGAISSDAWAHTPGFSNLTDIPPNGIYVQALLNPRQASSPSPTARMPLRLPLTFGHPDQIATQEGSPLPEYRFAGRYHGYFVDVRVDFGRLHPTAVMRRRANVLLARLRLPPRVVSAAGACRA